MDLFRLERVNSSDTFLRVLEKSWLVHCHSPYSLMVVMLIKGSTHAAFALLTATMWGISVIIPVGSFVASLCDCRTRHVVSKGFDARRLSLYGRAKRGHPNISGFGRSPFLERWGRGGGVWSISPPTGLGAAYKCGT